jgi:hypothetical protein
MDLANLWLLRNGLKINSGKTNAMLIHSSKKNVPSNLKLETIGCSVEQVRWFIFLGVVVNEALTWSDHIDLLCKKVSRSLNLLHRLLYFLPRPLLLLSLNSYILPHLDYCDVVWFSYTKSQFLCLETTMNVA